MRHVSSLLGDRVGMGSSFYVNALSGARIRRCVGVGLGMSIEEAARVPTECPLQASTAYSSITQARKKLAIPLAI